MLNLCFNQSSIISTVDVLYILCYNNPIKMNKISNRIMFLSPTVQAGWENQSFRSDFENISILGQGSYGIVWKAKHKKTGAIYAIKQIKKKSISNQKMIENVRNEVKIMYCLNNANIVKLYNHFEDEFSIYFILQFAEKGELYKAMLKSTNKKLEQTIAARYIAQITRALKYIHSLNIIHRDIKPENILIAANDELKLADFGWSSFNHGQNKRQTYCGTLDYLAPQMVDQLHLHDYRVDIWSLGVLIYQLCTGSSPFSYQLLKSNNLSQNGIKKNIANLNYNLPAQLSVPCKDIISKILVLKPQDRLSIAGILAHPWLTRVQVNIEKEGALNQDWKKKLKYDFGQILQSKEEEVKRFEAFSKEQIYDCTRMESIINAHQKQKGGQNSDKKLKQYELKIKQLELFKRRQEQQLKYLRNVKTEHQQLLGQMGHLREQHKQQTKKMQMMAIRLQQLEKMLRDKQK